MNIESSLNTKVFFFVIIPQAINYNYLQSTDICRGCKMPGWKCVSVISKHYAIF